MTISKVNITICPTCGSKKIRRVRRDVTRNFKGKEYTVPNLEFYECPDCDERVFDREAMRQIESYSPAFKRAQPKRKSARSSRTASAFKS